MCLSPAEQARVFTEMSLYLSLLHRTVRTETFRDCLRTDFYVFIHKSVQHCRDKAGTDIFSQFYQCAYMNTEQPKHYLEEGGMALQLGRAEGSHWTQAGPELDIREKRTGSEQQTRRSLH